MYFKKGKTLKFISVTREIKTGEGYHGLPIRRRFHFQKVGAPQAVCKVKNPDWRSNLWPLDRECKQPATELSSHTNELSETVLEAHRCYNTNLSS